jgi:hypothetical protein
MIRPPYRYLFVLVLLLFCFYGFSQTIANYRITDWSGAGVKDSIPIYANTLNIMSYGGDSVGAKPNDTAFLNAITALNNKPGVIYFPAGRYLFHQTMYLHDRVIIKGDGNNTKLLFDLGGAPANAINIIGDATGSLWNIVQTITRNDTVLHADNTTGLNTGDFILLSGNDSNLITSGWAYHTVGQIVQVKNIIGNSIITDAPIRRNYDISFAGKLKKLYPVKGAGLECLYLERVDSTAQQSSNVCFTYAVNSWMIGVESYKTNFAHVEVDYSAHITIRGNYIHYSFGYGGNGQGYGVAMEYTSGDCLVENNIFEHLRHSMLVQAGANGNVFAYNYSKDPYWTEPSLPSNAAGDAVCHGNYPYLNLFEGNILQNIVVDNSHGINGPFNTFFRNRAELYGIVQNTGPATDSMNFVGNEITNTGPFMGNYILAGNGYFNWGNNVKGIITPNGTSTLPERSLYLNTAPEYWIHGLLFPSIGTPGPYDLYGNSAEYRDTTIYLTDCAKNPKLDGALVQGVSKDDLIKIYPNPVNSKLNLSSVGIIQSVEIYNVLSQLVFSGEYNRKYIYIDLSDFRSGIYFIKVNHAMVQRIIKQ